MLGVAAKLERRRIMERTARRGRDTTQRCPQLQRQSGDDFEAQLMTISETITHNFDTTLDCTAGFRRLWCLTL
jgi:hypothetical protein